VWILRKVLNPLSPVETMELLLDKLSKTAATGSSWVHERVGEAGNLQSVAAGGDRQLRVLDTLGGGQQAGQALHVRRRATQGNQLHAVVMVQMDMQHG